ncbi:MAG: DNA polymerase III subunit delta [Ilumatobacteraceae bacterium]
MAVHLITGDDESLILSGVSELVHRLVGEGDRSLMVDDFDGPDYEVAAVVDSAQTPPFLTDCRIVIARGIGRFTGDEVPPLVAYLADPLPSTELVLVGGGGKPVKALTDALKTAGAHVTSTVPPQKDRSIWIEQQVVASGLRIDGGARTVLAAWMGEDAGRLQGLIDTLVSTYGAGHRVSPDDIQPFLGEAGDVPPWDLTDAIDRGDTTRSLTLLHRMMGSGERHPLQVMAVLQGHYTKILKLDGTDARDEASAAAVLGIKPYPARKVLDQYRRLSGTGAARAVGLLAQADLDLRGAKEWPDSLVMEILVARLSKLAGSGRR